MLQKELWPHLPSKADEEPRLPPSEAVVRSHKAPVRVVSQRLTKGLRLLLFTLSTGVVLEKPEEEAGLSPPPSGNEATPPLTL